MTIRRAAGFTALGSFIAMIALMVLMVVQAIRAPEPGRGGAIGVIALAEGPALGGIMLPDQQLAVLQALGARWDLRGVQAMTFEAIDGLPVVVVMLRRPLAYSEAIDLDAWVRAGGRALVLAEPGRSWAGPGDTVESNLRDSTWGLRLAARNDGPLALPGGGTLMLRNAGRWTASAGCSLRVDSFMAECRPGKGRVLLVADTGLLDRNAFDLNGAGFDSATGMIGQLVEVLEQNRPLPAAFVQGGGRYAPAQPPMALIMAMGALFWLAVGAVAVWAILLGMAKTSRERPTGPARIVRDPIPTGPARTVRQPAATAHDEDPVPE
jgi:hypothetical protein